MKRKFVVVEQYQHQYHMRVSTYVIFILIQYFYYHMRFSNLYIYIYIYITKLVYAWLLILAILFYKITLYLFNNIINSFKSNIIITNFSTIFLQIV